MELLAVSTGVAIAYGIGLWAVLIIGPATVTVLKGQWPLFDRGWYTLGIVCWITGFRLARPESWWARHLYGPAKLARAEARYPETLDEEEGMTENPTHRGSASQPRSSSPSAPSRRSWRSEGSSVSNAGLSEIFGPPTLIGQGYQEAVTAWPDPGTDCASVTA